MDRSIQAARPRTRCMGAPFEATIRSSGVAIPAGASPIKYFGLACANRSPDCQTILNAIKANVASSAVADASGSTKFANIQPGTYCLMISTRFNNQPLAWLQPVTVDPGQNSITLDRNNTTPVN